MAINGISLNQYISKQSYTQLNKVSVQKEINGIPESQTEEKNESITVEQAEHSAKSSAAQNSTTSGRRIIMRV